MATNPLIAQGTLNRLRGSLVVPSFSSLNVTNGYLGKMGIRLTLQGDATLMIDTMTGMVTSPEPYMPADIIIHLLRTQNLATLWRIQLETISVLGNVTVHTDSTIWPRYNFVNVAITTIAELPFDGTNPEFAVTMRGTYPINSNLFNF